MNLIDQMYRHLSLNHQSILARNDLHQFKSRSDHATTCEYTQSDHRSIDRCPDLNIGQIKVLADQPCSEPFSSAGGVIWINLIGPSIISL